MAKGQLYIVSAPSGAGKTSLLKSLCDGMSDICVAVSFTTRAMRLGEEDGVHYHFVSEATFKQGIEQNDFLEHAQVFDNYYGTSKSAVEALLNSGQDVILEIDWQGAQRVRQLMPDAINIFILPPSVEALETRLKARQQDSDDVIQRRMSQAKTDMQHYSDYQFLVINDAFETALEELKSIFQCHRLTVDRQQQQYPEFLSSLD